MAKFRSTKLVKATGSTSNATPTAINLIDLSAPVFCEAINNQGVYIELVAIARKASSGETASATVAAVAKRISGTLTVIQSSAAALLNSDLAIAALSVQASTDTLQALVTGVALTNIDWTIHTKLWTD